MEKIEESEVKIIRAANPKISEEDVKEYVERVEELTKGKIELLDTLYHM